MDKAMSDSGLLLEDGTWFPGELWGNENSGEVVFNTSMTGYQEVITDPSYCNQIIVMTYPLIGNYGVHENEPEASKIACKGIIVKEFFEFESKDGINSLQSLLNDHGVCVLSGVDTRALTKKIRNHGAMKGIIIKNGEEKEAKLQEIQSKSFLGGVKKCSSKEVQVFGEGKHIALYDFGYKKSILNSLLSRGFKVSVLPYNTTYETLESLGVEGVVLSNGPGDPTELEDLLPTIEKIQNNYPTLGICLGHQLISLANGAKTKKMLFGHRGANQAVLDLQKNKSFISSQNHGYEVDSDTIDENKIEVTHINVNDKSIEGIKLKNLPVFSVQFHPEANPGPMDTAYIFDDFLNMLERNTNEN